MAELLKLKTGITWTEVHYRGNAPAINDLIAGHVDVGFQQLTDSRQHIEGRQAPRAGGAGAEARAAPCPTCRPSSRPACPTCRASPSTALFAPKGTPPAVVDKLSAAIRAALEKKSVVDKLGELGSEARGSTPEEFTKFLEQETAKWTDVMQKANIKVQE